MVSDAYFKHCRLNHDLVREKQYWLKDQDGQWKEGIPKTNEDDVVYDASQPEAKATISYAWLAQDSQMYGNIEYVEPTGAGAGATGFSAPADT
jgi:hypothetical protein